MFESLISKFPMPIPVDFMAREAIGPYAVEFSDCEAQYKDNWNWRGPVASFLDENNRTVAIIMLAGPCYVGDQRDNPLDRLDADFYVDKKESPFYGEDVSPEQFIEFMMTEYPPIAEWLLWHL